MSDVNLSCPNHCLAGCEDCDPRYQHQMAVVYLDNQGRQVWPSTETAQWYTQAARCLICGTENSGVPCVKR